MSVAPGYVALLASAELTWRVRAAYARLRACDLCPRTCGVDRTAGERGSCRIGSRAVVAAAHPHFGEEAPLVGSGGSGTVFFAGCNLHCLYCQNHDISQSAEGDELEPEELAAVMLRLQDVGCHNINLVSPSHVVPQMMAAVLIAAQAGLRLPLVYNSGGYDSLQTLALLDGVVDIYMPDAKYEDAGIGRRLSGVPNYPTVNRAVMAEMHRQVGDLRLNEHGIAQRGLLVRHLVLPARLAGTARTMAWIAREISPRTSVNLMAHYRPSYRAPRDPALNRRPTAAEYQEALAAAAAAGLQHLD